MEHSRVDQSANKSRLSISVNTSRWESRKGARCPVCHLDDEWRRDLFVAAYITGTRARRARGNAASCDVQSVPRSARETFLIGGDLSLYTRWGRARIYEQRAQARRVCLAIPRILNS